VCPSGFSFGKNKRLVNWLTIFYFGTRLLCRVPAIPGYNLKSLIMKKFLIVLAVAGVMTACGNNGKKPEAMKDKMEEKMDGKMEEKMDGKMEEKMDGKMEEKMNNKMEEMKDTVGKKMEEAKPKM
jgi:type I site-specific restriction endonuclease